MFENENPQRIKKSLQILGINDVCDEAYVLDEISKYIFDVKDNKKVGSKSKKNFDINYDYKFYFPDFLKYGINLNKEDIDWWEFTKILDSIMLDENSNMYRIMSYRNYEKPIKSEKTRANLKHQQMMKLKNKYSLPQKKEYGIEKLWNYLEKKAGENKE